jgi:hypothetical protein
MIMMRMEQRWLVGAIAVSLAQGAGAATARRIGDPWQ